MALEVVEGSDLSQLAEAHSLVPSPLKVEAAKKMATAREMETLRQLKDEPASAPANSGPAKNRTVWMGLALDSLLVSSMALAEGMRSTRPWACGLRGPDAGRSRR